MVRWHYTYYLSNKCAWSLCNWMMNTSQPLKSVWNPSAGWVSWVSCSSLLETGFKRFRDFSLWSLTLVLNDAMFFSDLRKHYNIFHCFVDHGAGHPGRDKHASPGHCCDLDAPWVRPPQQGQQICVGRRLDQGQRSHWESGKGLEPGNQDQPRPWCSQVVSCADNSTRLLKVGQPSLIIVTLDIMDISKYHCFMPCL